MGTEKPRFTITMDEELLSQIDDFKFDNRIKNQSKAIVQLVRNGLAKLEQDEENGIKKASEAADTATEASENVEAFSTVLKKAGIVQETGDISEADLDFLKAMFTALKAHFRAKE